MGQQLRFKDIDSKFLSERVSESVTLIRTINAVSRKPLILQFSGGRDSMCLLGLARDAGVTNYVVAYMATGLEFKGVVQFVKETCKKMGVPLIISNPSMHKGNIFKRIEQFQQFPGLIATWCCRDLKLRPQKKLLEKLYGRGTFYKLEGIRRWESIRRKFIYKDAAQVGVREDGEQKGSFEVFPILNWTDDDVTNYLELKGLPTSSLYRKFGVSGCSFCPFFQTDIYYEVLKQLPGHYDRFIAMEEKLGQPSVIGHIYLGDIKKAVLEGRPCPRSSDGQVDKPPCMVMYKGNLVPTCSVYGHLFIDGKCYRCDESG